MSSRLSRIHMEMNPEYAHLEKKKTKEYTARSTMESEGPYEFQINLIDIVEDGDEGNFEDENQPDYEAQRVLGQAGEMERRKLATMERENPDAEIDDQSTQSYRNYTVPLDTNTPWAFAPWTDVIDSNTNHMLYNDAGIIRTSKETELMARNHLEAGSGGWGAQQPTYMTRSGQVRRRPLGRGVRHLQQENQRMMGGGILMGLPNPHHTSGMREDQMADARVVSAVDQVARSMDPTLNRGVSMDPLTTDQVPWQNQNNWIFAQRADRASKEVDAMKMRLMDHHPLISNEFRKPARSSSGLDRLAVFQHAY